MKNSYRDGFNSGSWDDYDNYSKNYGGTRAYYGAWNEDGGWEGDPYSPKNDPSGMAFGGLGQPIYGYGGYRPQQRRPSRDINLAKASDEELSYLLKSQIALGEKN